MESPHEMHGHTANGTPHNSAKAGEIAPFVLMPGDPLRAQHIAETRLKGARRISEVRNMYAFTGTYKGQDVTVMGSGMGAPSMGIYSYELYSFYGVETIVRIGTCGGLRPEIDVGDLVIAMTASTDSNYAHQYALDGTFSPCADYGLLEKAVNSARSRGIRSWAGSILSSDIFSLYSAQPPESGWKKWARMGCAATDMECYALYCNAAYLGRKALTLLTCSDSNVSGKEMTPIERQTSLQSMFDVAFDLL
ncbi:MAG: purine-nucleoside phosphorylase [Spirochaetaceae bacterium]|nr:purine-nucleoside phosphorylase [Spirochaetaceae bacterium]